MPLTPDEQAALAEVAELVNSPTPDPVVDFDIDWLPGTTIVLPDLPKGTPVADISDAVLAAIHEARPNIDDSDAMALHDEVMERIL